jgi:ligand-binding sensor domain-containing protein
MVSRRRVVGLSAGVLFVAALFFCGFVYWRVHDVLGTVPDSSAIRVSILEVGTRRVGFEPVAPVADFYSAVAFQGDLFVCGSSNLFRYSAAGELKQTWSAGKDLPGFPLRQAVVRAGINEPELWIGTEGGGVLIYDGRRFRQLLPENAGLRNVTTLLPLGNGRVLIGTAESGVYTSDGKSLRLFHPAFAGLAVTALAGDEDAFWVGTRNDGAWYWRGAQAFHVTAGLVDKSILSLAATGGRAWVGTALGVTEFADGKLSRQLAPGSFARTLAVHDGVLWIGTIGQGILSVPLSEGRAHQHEGDVTAFTDVEHHLLGIGPGGIREFPDGLRLITPPADWLVSGHVTSIHADGLSRLWVGYFDRGLQVMDVQHPNASRRFEDDVLFCINRIKEDPERGVTGVATANGLALFDVSGRLRQVLDRESGLISSHVTDLLFRDGSMILATPAGLTFSGGDGMGSVSGFQGLVNNHVYTLADMDGTVYAGTLGGVSAIRSGLVKASFTTANSQLRQNWITASASVGGQLYLGTYGTGVVKLGVDGTTATYRAFARQRIEINPNAMLATTRGLYAGTAGQGLAILRNGEDRWRFVAEGIPSLNVTALDERDNILYVGTENGLVRIPESSILP